MAPRRRKQIGLPGAKPQPIPDMPFDPRTPMGPQAGMPTLADARRQSNSAAARAPRTPDAMPADYRMAPPQVDVDAQPPRSPAGRPLQRAAATGTALPTVGNANTDWATRNPNIDPRIAASNEQARQGAQDLWSGFKRGVSNLNETADDALGDVFALGTRGLAQGNDIAARTLGPVAPELASWMMNASDSARAAADTAAEVGLVTPGTANWGGGGAAVQAAPATPTRPRARTTQARPQPQSTAPARRSTPATAVSSALPPLDFGELVQNQSTAQAQPAQRVRPPVNRGTQRGSTVPGALTGYQAQAFGPILSSMLGSSGSVIASEPTPDVAEQAQGVLLQEFMDSYEATVEDIRQNVPPAEQAAALQAARANVQDSIGGLFKTSSAGNPLELILAQWAAQQMADR